MSTPTITMLKGHVSPETAFVVEDYPYGFRLRCKMRHWLEYAPKRGFRHVAQTSNPKASGLVWNKPKASTYFRFGAALYLDEKGHVQCSGLTEYTSGQGAAEWLKVFGEGLPDVPEAREYLERFIAAKLAYAAARKAAAEDGDTVKLPLSVGLVEARKAFAAPITVDQKRACVWKRTHADFKGKGEDGRRMIMLPVNFDGKGSGSSLACVDELDEASLDRLLK